MRYKTDKARREALASVVSFIKVLKGALANELVDTGEPPASSVLQPAALFR
jgi:hypothetical protein